MFEFVCQGGSGLYIKEFYEADWSVEWRFCAFYRVFHAAVQLGVVNDLVYEGDLFWAFCFPVRLLGFVPVPDSRAVIMECVFEDLCSVLNPMFCSQSLSVSERFLGSGSTLFHMYFAVIFCKIDMYYVVRGFLLSELFGLCEGECLDGRGGE